MPNIFELWKSNQLGKGTCLRLPIQKRQILLPQSITGEKDQVVTTVGVARQDAPLSRCMCVSTGDLYHHNSQLLLIGEVLPIPLTLTAYHGAINGSVALHLTCAALFSMPKQLISARSICREQMEKYPESMFCFGKHRGISYWVDDYTELTGEPGKSVSGGLHYICDEKQECVSNLCEIISNEGKDSESPIYFGETYTNFIRPVYYVSIRNPALELEFENGAWTIKD